MTETEEFLAATLPQLTEAETALHNGDPAGRIAMWSRTDPVTVFGAALSARGWGEIGPMFGQLGTVSTGPRPSRSRSAPPPSSAARTASGRSSTGTPTRSPPTSRRKY